MKTACHKFYIDAYTYTFSSTFLCRSRRYFFLFLLICGQAYRAIRTCARVCGIFRPGSRDVDGLAGGWLGNAALKKPASSHRPDAELVREGDECNAAEEYTYGENDGSEVNRPPPAAPMLFASRDVVRLFTLDVFFSFFLEFGRGIRGNNIFAGLWLIYINVSGRGTDWKFESK